MRKGPSISGYARKIVRPMLTESFPFNYVLKSKFSLSRHSEYANEQITYHLWLCFFLRNSRRKSGVGKMNGIAIANRQQNSFKIKDNNVYGSSYYWNFRTSTFTQVACLILKGEALLTAMRFLIISYTPILITKYLFTGSMKLWNKVVFKNKIKINSLRNSQICNHFNSSQLK